MNNPEEVLPEGISLERQSGTRIITYRWYSNFYIPLMIFFMIWDAGVFYNVMQTILHHDPNMWESLLFATPHILVGLFMTYYLLAILVNKTIIELGNAELRLTHTPLPWRGNHQTVRMIDLQRIECETGRGSRHSPSTDVVLYFNNGERRKLLSGIRKWASACFIRDQVWEFKNRPLYQDFSPRLSSASTRDYSEGRQSRGHSIFVRAGNALIAVFAIIMVGSTFVLFSSFSALNADTRMISPGSYDRIEIWDLQADDSVRVTLFDTFAEAASKHSDWFSIPLVSKDADVATVTPMAGTLIEHRVTDLAYNSQTYRSHSYFIETDQQTFGCSVTFTVLPHLHITGASSRLISIGLYPSNTVAAQTSTVIVVILPDGASDIAVTDMEPYKTLTQNARKLYYYDAQSVTTHESIHIAYTLTGIPTTDVDLDAVIHNSKP